MAGLFDRIKNWSPLENLTDEAINAEFNNIIANFIPSKLDDYSANVTQMRLQTDPGAAGSESLPTSAAGELERLRFALARIIGSTYWYETPTSSLLVLNSNLNQITRIPRNRIISGRKDANNQPMFLVPDGATNTVRIKAGVTPLVVFIDNVSYTFSADIVVSGLTVAAANNCNAGANGDATATEGLDGPNSSLAITTATTGITALAGLGKLAAFKTAGTEYFVCKVASSTLIHRGFRGYFFNSADANLPRAGITSGDILTLAQLTWIFLKSDGAAFATYSQPVVSGTQPATPAIGDMWFNPYTEIWKQYNGAGYVAVSCVPVGVCVQNATATVAARSFDFFQLYNSLDTVELDLRGNTLLGSKFPNARVSVAGQTFIYDTAEFIVKSTEIEGGSTFANGKTLYVYVQDNGIPILSETPPHDRLHDLGGYYHPAKPWRALGFSRIGSTPAFNPPVTYNNPGHSRITQYNMLLRATSSAPGVGGFAKTSSSGLSAFTSSTSAVQIPNLAINLSTIGNPVFVGIDDHEGSAGGSYIRVSKTNNAVGGGIITLKRDGTIFKSAPFYVETNGVGAGTLETFYPCSLFQYDARPAGDYAYTATYQVTNGAYVMYAIEARLVAFELK